ncbi:MAG: hypothetical protein P1U39_03725 [Legionellaceae bacterium]|nr:hypothetical protein [Legionellaceae bacterium]
MVIPGGWLGVDYYEKSVNSLMLPKYWLRSLTKRLAKPRLFSILKRFVPVADYKNILPLSSRQLREWALLDTFDWLSPEYDNSQHSSERDSYWRDLD